MGKVLYDPIPSRSLTITLPHTYYTLTIILFPHVHSRPHLNSPPSSPPPPHPHPHSLAQIQYPHGAALSHVCQRATSLGKRLWWSSSHSHNGTRASEGVTLSMTFILMIILNMILVIIITIALTRRYSHRRLYTR